MTLAIMVNVVLGLIGAAVGAVAGYYVYWWILNQWLNALVLPGAMVGLGCAVACLRGSRLLGVVCGVAALGFGVFCEWSHAPFAKDESLAFFVTHLYWLRPIKLVMIALGGLMGYWLGQSSLFEYWKGRSLGQKLQPPAEKS